MYFIVYTPHLQKKITSSARREHAEGHATHFPPGLKTLRSPTHLTTQRGILPPVFRALVFGLAPCLSSKFAGTAEKVGATQLKWMTELPGDIDMQCLKIILAPHTNELRDAPCCRALSLPQKPLHYREIRQKSLLGPT